MNHKTTVLAIITARGGSKGLPGKNIRPLMGKPLIGWTIEQAKRCRYVTEIFVSTDDEKIASACREFGIEVPELRPAELATDTASSMDVLQYVIEYFEKKDQQFDYILLLEPTSPMRKRDDLDNAISLAIENPDADGVISLGEVHTEHPAILKGIGADGYLVPFMQEERSAYQRQQHKPVYFPYGVCYLIKTESFRKYHTIYGEKMLPYYIERWQNYEIDDIYDFKCIEAIMAMEVNKL